MRRTRRLSDPTIPRKSPGMGNTANRNEVSGPTWGKLVDYGDEIGVVLTDARGNTWSKESVRGLVGSFGNPDEGFHRSPRPWKYAGDVPTVEGDTFLITFLDNNPDKPVILGGVRPLKTNDEDNFPAQPLGEDPNPGRMRMVLRDDAGLITGHVQATALDGGRNLEIVVGGSTFGSGLRLLIDHTAGVVKVGAGSETERVVLGDALLMDLKLAIEDIVAGLAGVPYTATVATQFGIDIGTALGAGAPYLSNNVKVD